MSAQIIQFAAAEPEPLDQRAREHEADDYPAEAYDEDAPPPLPLGNWPREVFDWLVACLGPIGARVAIGLALFLIWGVAGWIAS
jgi:hypothetical protein